MSFFVELITMTQEMDLADGSTSHFIVLKLPSGVFVKALITDESAVAVVHAKVTGAPPPPMPVAPQPSTPLPDTSSLFQSTPMEDGTSAMVFGGQEVAATPIQPVLMPLPANKSKIVRVEKDEWGYPIVRRNGSADPGEVVGGSGHNRDEDGVGQM